MIYLDSAATSLQKPQEVAQAVLWAIRCCASPGRGSHRPAELAARTAFQCRQLLADWFDCAGPEQVIFTSSATHSLNLAIRSLVPPGGRVVISGYEHNAVTRTLSGIPGVAITVARDGLFEPERDLEAFARAVETRPNAAVCTHVSNVFGYRLPVEEIAGLCREAQVPLIVDASQSAGVLPIQVEHWGAAYVAFPGHKGLMGPQGIGVLLCGRDSMPEPLLTGGTGSESLLQAMPAFLPDRLEAGTHNLPGIAGLLAGARFLRRVGTERVCAHERRLASQLVRRLRQIPGVEVLYPEDIGRGTGVVSFRLRGVDCETATARLGERGIALRGGLHCAPLAHETAGTLDTGTIRASVSLFNRPEELACLAAAVRTLREK